MTIQRRTIVLGLPLATTLMLTGCGGGEDGTPTSSSERAGKMALGSGTTSGSIAVAPMVSGSWLTSGSPVKPTDSRVQAVLNGNDLHVSISDVASDATRAITLVLRNLTAWTENTEYMFMAANSTAGTLEGMFTHFSPATSTASAKKMFYKITAGTVIAKKDGDFVTLVFSPSSSSQVTATKAALPSWSANDAPPDGRVNIRYTATARTIKLNLVTENETSA